MSKFIKERNAAFEADDIAWAKRNLPPLSSQRVLEAAFHKARLACEDVSRGKRDESRKWLFANKFAPAGQCWKGGH